MKVLKVTAIILALSLALSPICLCDGAFTATGEAITTSMSLPQVSAKAYVLCDAKTGEVLFSKNENDRLPIASTTKIMTALVAIENLNLDDIVTVDKESVGIEGSSIYLYEGEKLSVRDLVYALLLESANDAAVCLARYTSGSVEDFAKLMNERGEKMGLKNTHFNNPHGLEDSEHYSSAGDLAKILMTAYDNPTFAEILGTKNYKIPLKGSEAYRYLSNHNRLLSTYSPCLGGKTGYTKNAGRCLVTISEKNGVKLVCVTLSDPLDFEDHKNLCEYGFSLYSSVILADPDGLHITVPVVGCDTKSVVLVNHEGLTVSVTDATKIKTVWEVPRFLYANTVKKDTSFGRVAYYLNGKCIGTAELYPTQDIEIKEEEGFFERLYNLIFKK